jgi:hypothetical protein
MFASLKFLLLPVMALTLTTPADLQRPYTILPASEAQNTTKLCSREGPAKVDGGWEPSDSTIQIAESQLAQLSQAAMKQQTMQSPTGYFRQYVGIVIAGRKLIYLNAIADETSYWKTKFVSVCDGGSGFWGAIYDPATRKFSDLHENGFG